LPTADAAAKPRPIATGWALALIVLAMVLVVLVAGVPGEDRTAGDGSDKLRHGWAQKRAEAAARAEAERAAEQPAPVEPAAQPAPVDAPR